MIANATRTQHPLFARIVRGQHDTARARDHDTRTVFYVDTVEGRTSRRRLLCPFETSVVRHQNDAVRAHRPAAFFIRRELDAVDGISLRERVLPLPTTHRILRTSRRREEKAED